MASDQMSSILIQMRESVINNSSRVCSTAMPTIYLPLALVSCIRVGLGRQLKGDLVWIHAYVLVTFGIKQLLPVGHWQICSGKEPAVRATCSIVGCRYGMSSSVKWVFNLLLVNYFVETNRLLGE